MQFFSWISDRFAAQPLGIRGEKAAAKYLKRHGYKVITTRLRQRYGEIDIIALEGETVVFVEVKTRRDASQGRGAEAVDSERQSRLTRAALAFLKSHGLLEYPSRFDVIEVYWSNNQRSPKINHIREAFKAVGKLQMHN